MEGWLIGDWLMVNWSQWEGDFNSLARSFVPKACPLGAGKHFAPPTTAFEDKQDDRVEIATHRFAMLAMTILAYSGQRIAYRSWIPAYAGMTNAGIRDSEGNAKW